VDGEVVPSAGFEEGGIQEAIMDYEDGIFFVILAEELARRDLALEPGDSSGGSELTQRMQEYMEEFELNGLEHVTVERDDE